MTSSSYRQAVVLLLSVLFVGAVVSVVSAVAAASPAAAHTGLKASSPRDGARIDAAPTQVTLEFTGPVRTEVARVVVRGPGDAAVESGAPEVSGATVVQQLQPLQAAGEYEIAYRVVASDGHPVTGTVSFTLTQAPTEGGTGGGASASPEATVPSPPVDTGTESTSASEGEESGGLPTWAAGVAGAAVVVAAGGAVWFGRRATRDID